MMRILVTGANGQLGKCLQQVVKQNPIPTFDVVFKTKDQLDLSNHQAVESFFFTNQFDYCVNCAAYTAVDLAESEVEKAFKVNADATELLAKECKEQDIKFIHLSTDYVFDGESDIPYQETDTVNPQSVYGKSKLQGEQRALNVNPSSLIIRTAWVYSHYGKNFVKTMQQLMQSKKEINVVQDQIGSPTNAIDLANAIVAIIQNGAKHSGLYHYSNQGEVSWYDFAIAIKEINQYTTKINPIPSTAFPTPAKRPKFSLLDKSKIIKDFGVIVPDWKQSLTQHFNNQNNA